MAATLEDVIERLKAEGQLTRNTGANSIKTISKRIETFTPIFESIKTNLEIQTKTLQEFLEKKRTDDSLGSVSGDATPSDPTPTTEPPEERKPKKSKEKDFDFFSNKMLLLAGGLAAAAGVAIGMIKGQFTAIKSFFKFLTPKLFKTFTDFVDNIKNGMISLKTRVAVIFDDAVKAIRNIFSFDPASRIGRVLTAFRNTFDALIEPFKVAINAITDIVTNVRSSTNIVTTTLGKIGGFLKSIGGVFTRMVGLVGKLFAPIAIIMTAIDTVKGAIEGYADGGIFGAIQGAIDGFFTSLVTVPLDLIKDLVAWVLGKLGFDESAEALNSFSFTEIWKNLTDTIFGGIKSAFSVITDLFSFGEEDKTALGLLGKFTDLVYAPINMAINFVKGLFGFKETDVPFKLQDWIAEKATAIFSYLGVKFSQLGDYISSVPDHVKLFAEGMFIDVSEKLRIGFTSLGAWIASIPARIKLMALNAIRSATSGLPEWAQIVSQEDVATAEASVNARDTELENSIAQIRESAQSAREDLERRRAELDAVQNAASTGAAPTVIIQGGPVSTNIQQNTRGGSSVQQNNISGGASDLDYGLPSGVR